MDRSAARPAHESHKFYGHDARMADHDRRIRSAACECGSGKRYGDCCLDSDHQRSSARISYSLPGSVHPDVVARCEVEDHLRLRAFGAFYKASHEEHDLLVRFVGALVASAAPIKDPGQIMPWHGRFCSRRTTRRTEGAP